MQWDCRDHRDLGCSVYHVTQDSVRDIETCPGNAGYRGDLEVSEGFGTGSESKSNREAPISGSGQHPSFSKWVS